MRTQMTLRSSPRSSVGVGMGFGSSSSFWALGFGTPLGPADYEATISYHLAVFVVRLYTAEEARELEQREDAPQVYGAGYLLRSLEPKKQASQRKDS